jgi:hypothetical protein
MQVIGTFSVEHLLLSDVPEAIRYLETGHASGKLVVPIRR